MKISKKYLDLVNECKKRIKEISVVETSELLNYEKKVKLIDIREESEWAERRIPGAIYCGKGILEREIENLIPDINYRIILYCGGGYRSAISAECLMRMGYTNVFSMQGGISGWEELGLPISK